MTHDVGTSKAQFMNRRDSKYLDEAIELARAGDRVGGARIGAVMVIGNRVVSMGQNMLKTHPLQKRYGKNPEAIYQHAEINCIVNFLRKNPANELEKATLYIGRVHGQEMESVGIAKPCSGCAHAIHQFGIKRVIHS